MQVLYHPQILNCPNGKWQYIVNKLRNFQASIFGGVAAQEALKAVTGKHVPIHFCFAFTALNWLYADPKPCSSSEGKFSNQIDLFGEEAQQILESLKVFMVGAGAVGCELLKNMALMGIGTGASGMIHVTDIDDIL